MSDIIEKKQNSFEKKRKKNIFKSQPFYLLVIILVAGLIVSLTNPNFLKLNNIMNIFTQSSVFGIITLASAVVLISGGIDLSVGQMMSFSCCIITKLIINGTDPAVAVLIGILVATGCGLINGAIVSYSKCPPFIITLGMTGVYTGGALMVTDGIIINVPSSIKLFGEGMVGFMPIAVIIFLVACILVYFLLTRTRVGRRLYAAGGNEEAALYSGINVRLYKFLVYGFGGLLVGIASLVLLDRLGSANAVMGQGYELEAIAAAVIGGVSLSGGKGSIIGAFFGVLLLGVISNGLNIIGVNPYLQELILGAIIVIAVVASNLGKKK